MTIFVASVGQTFEALFEAEEVFTNKLIEFHHLFVTHLLHDLNLKLRSATVTQTMMKTL
jgi:hypothetical protein